MPKTKPEASITETFTEALKTNCLRYAVLEHTEDAQGVCQHSLVSRHRTKAAAVRAWARAREEAGWLYGDEEWCFVECVYLDDVPEAPSHFRDDDYLVCAPDQLGECDVCRRRERPCYGRLADGRCRRAVREAAGPWLVYALADPADGETRYIGCTEKSLGVRLSQHLCTPGGARGAWVGSLREQGRRPAIREVARFATREEGLRREYHLINTLPGLTNARRTQRGLEAVPRPGPDAAMNAHTLLTAALPEDYLAGSEDLSA